MTLSAADVRILQDKVWHGSLSLEIRLSSTDCRTFDESDPYLIQCPRLSYLAFLLPRLHAFFSIFLINPDLTPWDGWLSFESVPLKWHYPVGLLYDLFSGAEPASSDTGRAAGPHGDGRAGEARSETRPWRLVLHYSDWPEELVGLDAEGKIMHDAFINTVKEADFLRNGTAKAVMSLSKDDSTQLWQAVQTHDLLAFNAVNNKLLNPPGMSFRHVPLKFYLPKAAPKESALEPDEKEIVPGTLDVLQKLIPATMASGESQTIGTALHHAIPSLFPSRRNAVYALPVMHGIVVPLKASLQALLKTATYADGFLYISIFLLS